jgi:two-component system sensor histidine kinase/response regulator
MSGLKKAEAGSLVNDSLREIMRNSEDYFFVKDTELVYHGSSFVFARMVGLDDPAQLVGKKDCDLFPKDLAEKYCSDDRTVLECGVPITGTVERLPDQDGQQRWTKTWKYAIRDTKGNIIGLYGISRDVSRAVEMENKIKVAENYFDLISRVPGGVSIFHVVDGIALLDYANDGCFEVHHRTRSARSEVGLRVLDVVYEPDRKNVCEEYKRIRNHPGKTASVDFRVKGEDGKLHWVNIHFREAYIKDEIPYYYAFYSGLDGQKHTEEKLQESRDALREAMANSDLQFFTYFPGQSRGVIYANSKRLSELPTVWTHFPDDFLDYTQTSPGDAEAYRDMIRAIDRGDDEAQCLVRLAYKGVYSWERIRLKAIRDESGAVVRAQGYSLNVTAQKNAEERLRKERVRLKTMDRGVFESFSFNLTKSDNPEVQTEDKALLEGSVSKDILNEAISICPPLANTNPATRDILLRAAARIPEKKDRELFISTCSGTAVRMAISEGRYSADIRYRRYVGNEIKWVSTSAEVLPDPESGDLIAFYYTKDIDDEVMRAKICNEIIGQNYASVSCLDLRTGIFKVIAGTDQALLRLSGKNYSEAIDMASESFVSDEDAEKYRQQLSLNTVTAALEKESYYTVYNLRREVETRLPGNPARRMKNDIFYLDDNRDRIIYLLSDVTEVFEQERESREKLEMALAAAEQASVAKTEFLSRMSHEIRTPMNAIIGLDAIALQEKDISVTMEDHLQKIGISARFLLSLINDILDMSRIESGRMALQNESFNFEEMVNGINTILYEQCRDNGLEYECVLKSYTEEAYIGDATKLQQVLINLLGNAVKFTPRGGKIHFMIGQISRTKEKARLRFEISDTGIGIDEKFLPHLFEPFSQENRGRTSAYGGTGLGLAISKNIVALMNGEIAVHSIKNVGSEFTVEVDLGITKESMRRRELSQNLRPLFTLIVDDDVIVCRHTQLILSDAGLKTEYVDSGAGAVDKVLAQHKVREDYDLILLDWKMPDMDGIETARQIRKIVGPEVTIIIMTAYDWADIEKKARAAGVDLFMKKPVFASSVTKAFENVLLRKTVELQPEKEPDYDFTGRRILLAEDNTINAEIATNLLEMKGCEVEIATNGVEAVESFAAAPVGRYDAILMDVRMPVMDGLDATRAIRAMRKADARTVPIFAMTANAFQEDVKMSLDAGMNAHLTKPIEPVTLYETLKRHFEKLNIS